MSAHGSPILLEAVVSTPCCGKVSEIYEWRIFEGNSEIRLGILINEEQARFYRRNPQYYSQIGYILAPCCLHDFSPKCVNSIKPIIDLGFVPLCVYDYRSLTESQLRENAIMIMNLLRYSHSFAYFPDNVNLTAEDKENLPNGLEFKNEIQLRIIFYLNLEYNVRVLNNPILRRFLSEYSIEGGKGDE